MSAESLAAFRKTAGNDLANLAEEHLKHDLTDSDRAVLKSAASSLSTHALIGSLLGLGLGTFLAYRLRTNRLQMYRAFRTSERPTHVKFADGREEIIPDIAPLIKPSRLGDFATYTFFGLGGLFLGGETGLLSGSWAAKRKVRQDPSAEKRIERAFRGFRADVLRKQIEILESGRKESGDVTEGWL